MSKQRGRSKTGHIWLEREIAKELRSWMEWPHGGAQGEILPIQYELEPNWLRLFHLWDSENSYYGDAVYYGRRTS